MPRPQDPKAKAVMTVITGPSGAGKSTLAAILEQQEGTEFLEIDRSASRWGAGLSRSGRYDAMVRKVWELIAEGQDIGIDIVFGRRELSDLIEPAKAAGYRIESHIVGTCNPETCVHRVRKRAEQGGHGHPPEAVLQLHSDALATAGEIAALSDQVLLYDNSRRTMDEVARSRQGPKPEDWEVEHFPGIPEWAEEVIGPPVSARPARAQTGGIAR